MNKLKIWNDQTPWEQSEKEWDEGMQAAAEKAPIKGLKQLPDMVGITPDTAKNLKWKSLKWMLFQDHTGGIRKGFLQHPFRYGWNFLKSLIKKKSFLKKGDFFLYGIKNLKEFEQLLNEEKTLLVVGFSYCHKPFECPSGRFTDQCIHDPLNPVCRQCFIGKAINALSDKEAIPLLIPTVHYIGEKIFEIAHANPSKKVIFLITACELTLEMFGDWGNMVGIQGVGVRLDGRICNTLKAFELSEKGIKPGLTVVRKETQTEILNLIKGKKK